MRLLTLLLAGVALPAAAQEFPLTIDTKFGPVTIEAAPERVASLDYGGIDNLLAVGISPVTVRAWRDQDGFAFTAGPWADHLRTNEPVILGDTLDFEQIAATDPDLIIAIYSGITQADFDSLSLIAPVVAVPPEVGDYSLTWQDRAIIAASAVGQEASATAQIAAINDRLAGIAAENPEWAGLTAVLGSLVGNTPDAFTSNDGRTQLILSMGFSSPPALEALTDAETYWLELSPERIDALDADVLVHYGSSADTLLALDSPLHSFLKAGTTGGEIFLPDQLVSAIAHVSLLSLPSAIDGLVPLIEAAADGDPATLVPDARQ